jgi:hypothetical protein
MRTRIQPRLGGLVSTVRPAAFVLALSAASAASAQESYVRTFLGAGGYERVQGVEVDASGRVFVAGHASDSSLASKLPAQAGGFDTTWNGSLDGFVAILSPDLREVQRWTLIGGNGEDRAYQVEIAPNGDVIAVGFSGSSNLPVGPGSANHGGWDAFVARFTPDLSSLLWCTAIGGSGNENPRGSVTVDAAGNVFLGGSTESLDFPTTPGAFQVLHAPIAPDPRDGFVVKLDAAGHVIWATLIGGSANDEAFSGCRLGADGSVYVAGMSNSSDFPTTPGAFQPQFGGHFPSAGPYAGDGFVARLSPDGSHLLFSTFLGGSGGDLVAVNDSLELDASGHPVVIGSTWSADFPVTANAHDRTFSGAGNGQPDGFVARLSPDGSQLLACTYLGGDRFEEPSGLAVGPGGEIVLSGNTESSDFPTTPDASQPTAPGGLCDAFVAKLSDDLRFLSYSTYVGGPGSTGHGDRGRGVTLLASGDVVVVGDTDSSNFPVSPGGVYDSTYDGGAADGFIDIELLSRSYSFGVGKTTSIGTVPSLALQGSTSVSSASAQLTVSDALPFASGCFGYSNGIVAGPHLGGAWYLDAPLHRGPGGVVQLDGSGGTAWSIAIGPEMLGETRVYQLWFRDAAHPDGTGSGLTNAVKVTFVP